MHEDDQNNKGWYSSIDDSVSPDADEVIDAGIFWIAFAVSYGNYLSGLKKIIVVTVEPNGSVICWKADDWIIPDDLPWVLPSYESNYAISCFGISDPTNFVNEERAHYNSKQVQEKTVSWNSNWKSCMEAFDREECYWIRNKKRIKLKTKCEIENSSPTRPAAA